MEQESYRRNHERGIVEGEACKRNHTRGIMKEEASGSIRGYLGGIWEASGRHQSIWKHLGASGSIKGRFQSGGPFSIIKMQSNRRDRTFYCRVAKVGDTLTADREAVADSSAVACRWPGGTNFGRS